LEAEMEELNSTIVSKTKALEKVKADRTEDQRSIHEQQRQLEKYLAKKALLLKKKEESIRNIRELGVLPEEAFEKYQNVKQTQTLVKNLHKVTENLKKFGHVNKKAFEQYNNFTKQRDSLDKRKEELDSSAQAIEDLVEVLDQRKDEAIQRTFKQVAKNFSEVWEKLVPAGYGQLIMLRRMDMSQEDEEDWEGTQEDAEEEDDEDEDDAEDTGGRSRKRKRGSTKKSKGKQPASKPAAAKSMIDNYTGVAIKVSFNSKTDEGLRMSQLSGGQKSLVALALIFAIQQCDPAPFYLFDEIDAALDAQYRTAVANMIHELSDNAQFITTTFRPELLVHSDKFYGVTFTNKVSRIQVITREDATQFVEQEQPQ
ncbi:Structural maintenance of chromosomes protein 3, partial [Quaeritorhiza haematococci]